MYFIYIIKMVRYITRRAYNRRSYRRKAYTRKDGTRVRAATVKRTHVGRARVPDKGLRGKTRKNRRVLPKLPRGALEKFGYRVNGSAASRKRAINRMIKKPGQKSALKHLRSLVVLRSYNKNSPNYRSINADVKRAQKLYHAKTGTPMRATKRRRRRAKRRTVRRRAAPRKRKTTRRRKTTRKRPTRRKRR